MSKTLIKSTSIILLSVLLTLFLAEGVIRLKNTSMQNYDIEMWKYSQKLKKPSANPIIGFEHIPSKEAQLQSVIIRTNEYGLRGKSVLPPNEKNRRILFLGSSVTLGWGVSEDKVITSLIRDKFVQNGQDVEVLNAGIGNVNSTRYVELFMTKLANLNPTDIVVHYVLRDAEILEPNRKNYILRHSQLATTLWIATSRMLGKFSKQSNEEYYQQVYSDSNPGLTDTIHALDRLAQYCKQKHIKIYFAMTPDMNDLVNYKFNDIHDKMKNITTKLGYTYIDLLPGLTGFSSKELWVMPTDPHPNELGHQKMADTLFPVLAANQNP